MSYTYMERLFLMFLDHTQRRSTVGRTPLDEWSARRRDLYLTTHDTQQTNIHAPGGIRTHDLSRFFVLSISLLHATCASNFRLYWVVTATPLTRIIKLLHISCTDSWNSEFQRSFFNHCRHHYHYMAVRKDFCLFSHTEVNTFLLECIT